MSRFDKNLPVKLDANGNLDTAVLARELTAALAYDVHYKQVDNMKKKAVKTSGSYDEFKAMVACSHLKKLTSKEVESLSSKKTGWQRDFRAANDSDAHILAQEAKMAGIEQAKTLSNTMRAAVDTFQVPRNLVVLETDLCRTLRTQAARVEYLLALGLKRLKALLKGDKECTPELLECLLDTIGFAASSQQSARELAAELPEIPSSEHPSGQAQAQAPTAGERAGAGDEPRPPVESVAPEEGAEHKAGVSTPECDAPKGTSEKEPEVDAKLDPYKWYKAVSSFSRFHVTLLFIPRPIVAAALEFLDAYKPAGDAKIEELLEVRSRFK
jgi:hypothetical protein